VVIGIGVVIEVVEKLERRMRCVGYLTALALPRGLNTLGFGQPG